MLDPDWLCESDALRDQLCAATIRPATLDIEIKRRFFTVRYRVTLEPQPDGSLSVTIAWITSSGELVPLGDPVIISADKVARFRMSCPPDPTNLTLRTVWQSPAGVVVDREHRVVAGEPAPLDVDDVAGPDLTIDMDYAPATVSFAQQWTATVEPSGSLAVTARRDPSASDDRGFQVSITSIPTVVTLAIDAASRRTSGSVTSPVARLDVSLHAGTLQGQSALNVNASVQEVTGQFDMTFASSVALTTATAIGMIEVSAWTNGRTPVSIPSDRFGLVQHLDEMGMATALRLPGSQGFSATIDPLDVRGRGAASSNLFDVELRHPGKLATLHLSATPVGLVVASRLTTAGYDLEFQAGRAPESAVIAADGITSLARGGAYSATFTRTSGAVLHMALDPTTAGEPQRFAFFGALAAEVEVSARPPGASMASTIHASGFQDLRGCFAFDGKCRPTDRVPEQLPPYLFSDEHPVQSGVDGGLNRPYAAQLSVDLHDERAFAPVTLSASIDRGDGVPITINRLQFTRFTFDAGMHPTSPMFDPGPKPRYYLYIDSDAEPFSVVSFRMPELLERLALDGGPSVADRRLVWLPGPTCTLAENGACVPDSERPDLRRNGVGTCASSLTATVFRVNGVLLAAFDYATLQSAICGN
ncbi:MAG: hypothetical protein ACREOK_10335 [Gemmatimonadaceae bacterium]